MNNQTVDEGESSESDFRYGLPALPKIVLPKLNRIESRFAHEVGREIGPLNVLFRYQDQIVEIKNEPFTGEIDKSNLAIGGLKFSTLSPTRARTWLEDYIATGVKVQPQSRNGSQPEKPKFIPKTMTPTVAGGLMVSPQFARHIPIIHRILDVAIPIKMRDGTVITPEPGFNDDLGVYCDPNTPKIDDKLSLDDAKKVLNSTLEGFSWKNNQSKTHAIARLLTPYARGIMGFRARPPLWYYNGNRPRAGKDYCAGIPQIVYLGHAFEDASLGEESEETRKRITAAIVSGRRMMHFANCQGYIQSAPFIQAITASVWRTRALGSTAAAADLELPNEIDYSISANVGLTYREDLEPRMRKIELAFYDEDENARHFKNTFLHDWVTENRALILSAVATFFKYWIDEGMVPGQTPFNSFPEWAQVIGGVMKVCNLGDPCLPHVDKDLVGGDLRTTAMKAVYELMFGLRPNLWTKKQDVYDLISANQTEDERLDWFGEFDGIHKKKTTTKTGIAINSFDKRVLSEITLEIDSSDSNSRRHKVRFIKEAK